MIEAARSGSCEAFENAARRWTTIPLVGAGVVGALLCAALLNPLAWMRAPAASAGPVVIAGLAALAAVLALSLRREVRRRDAREAQLLATVAALRQSEAGLHRVFDQSSDVLAVHGVEADGTFTIDRINQAAAAAWGLDPERVRGRRIEDVLPASVAADALAQLEPVVASGTTQRTKADTPTSEGRACETILVPLFDEAEPARVTQVLVSIRDVTHLRESERATAVSEARFRLMAENTSELIILGHGSGRRSYISPASMRLLGYAPHELAALRSRDWVHPDDLDRLTNASLGGAGTDTTIVCRVRHKDGGWIWVEGIFRHIHDARGDEPSIVATFRDISDRQARSDALREAKEAAETARADAEQASQAKSDFLAAMSHEIRTPLNAILGYTDILIDDAALDGERRRQIARIRNAGAALRTVVDDILDFSKLEAGGVELGSAPFAAVALADSAISIVRGAAEAKRLALTTDIPSDLPAVLVGDEDRLRQILLNLLNNAVKFTRAGAVTLSIRCVASRAGCAQLRFAVADTGIGIAAAKRSRLFQRFSQVDGSINREFGGTGLGLAISKSLVETMGGRIGVDSVLDEGSTFWFEVTLPIGGPLDASERPREAAPSVRSARILLVEDHEVNQELARAVLEAAGHVVEIAANGAEAVRAVERGRYDIILMDVQMPVMDGIAATRRIRAMAHPMCDVPIVAMTANVLPAQVLQFEAAGMDDHVGKPFKQDALHEAIRRHLCEPRLQPPAAAARAVQRTRTAL